MGNKSFDDIIRSKLKELEQMPGNSDWDTFEGMYDDALSGNESSFDDIIKTKLKELEQVPVTPDWEIFEEMYDDALSGTESAFDRSIASKVDHFNVQFNSQHWVLMKEKLEREEFIRTSIYFSKIAEASIIFLLLFTFLNLFPALQYEKSSAAFASIDKMEKETVTNITSPEPIINENSTLKTESISTNPSDQTRFNRISNSISAEKRSYIEVKEIKNPGIASSIKSSSEPSDLILNPVTESVSSELIALASIDNLEQNIENEKMEIYRAKVISTSLNKPKGESLVSFSFSPTVNIVNSPANYILNTEPYTVDALGFETGIGYSYRKGGFEIGTGVYYARKAYNPQIQNQITGKFSEGYAVETLKNIEFDLVSVPLFLNYSLLSGEDFNLYAGVGSSINMITTAGYKVRENGEVFDVLSRNQATGRSASRDYTQGILQGGKFHDNLFISLDLSIGLETKLSDRMSIFFAPTLRQHIGIAGIGPNKDHVHSLGLNMGLKRKI